MNHCFGKLKLLGPAILILVTMAIVCPACKDNGVGTIVLSEPQFIGMDNMLVTKLAYSTPYLYAGAASRGLWRRDLSRMNTWEYLGLADTSLGNYSNVGVLDLDIWGSDILVAYNGSAPSVDPWSTVGIWHSTDGGIDWFRSDSGIPETIDSTEYNVISACRRSPDKPETAIARFAAATYRSIDSGYHWELISGRPGIIGGDDHMRWHPFRQGEYWQFGSTSVFEPYMSAMKNYGLNVKVILNFNALGFPSGQIISDVAFDCGDPDITYAATSKGLMKSTDGGCNWIVGKPVIPNNDYVRFIVEHRSRPGILFLSGDILVYYSVDQGRTISVLAEMPRVVESMAMDEDGGRLFIGSAKGIYSVSFSSVVN